MDNKHSSHDLLTVIPTSFGAHTWAGEIPQSVEADDDFLWAESVMESKAVRKSVDCTGGTVSWFETRWHWLAEMAWVRALPHWWRYRGI